MRNPERSTGALLTALLACALLATALVLPWFQYEHSSGRKTAPGGYNDPADTRVERHTLTYGAGWQQGDQAPTDPQGANEVVTWTGQLILAATVAAGLLAFCELPYLPRLVPRGLVMVLQVLTLGAVATAAALAWYRMPATLSRLGVTQPFSSGLAADGYTRTGMDWGFAAACLSAPAFLGALLFKYQTQAKKEQTLIQRALAATRRPHS